MLKLTNKNPPFEKRFYGSLIRLYGANQFTPVIKAKVWPECLTIERDPLTLQSPT